MELCLIVKSDVAHFEINIEESLGGSSDAASEADARKFLQRFNFPSNRWYDRVGKLSGGERRRLQLLQILARRPNVIVLDEPSNDLDLSTLASLLVASECSCYKF